MSTNAVALAIVAKAAAIAGMRGTSAWQPDTVPASPFTIVGNHRAVVSGGVAQEHVAFTFPVRCYVERTADDARTQATVNDLCDAFVAAYRSGITLGATVTQCRLNGWNTDLYAEIGGAVYQVIEFDVEVLMVTPGAYTT